MAVRKIIKIDEDLCDGCGDCVSACHEGAIQIIDGVAKVVNESYCDGLGDCIGECPQGAITIEEREAVDYDEAAVARHLAGLKQGAPAGLAVAGSPEPKGEERLPCGCPGSAMQQLPSDLSQAFFNVLANDLVDETIFLRGFNQQNSGDQFFQCRHDLGMAASRG